MQRLRRVLILTCCALALVCASVAAPAGATFAGNNGRILFSRHGDDQGIYTVGSDGTGLRRLTTGNDGSASWSPDGRRIAFVRDRYPRPGVILVMNADGSGVTRVARGGGRAGCGLQPPHWSYDGSYLAYADDCFDLEPRVAQLFVAATDGSGVRALTDATSLNGLSSQPWSPDLGPIPRLAFSSDRSGSHEVYTVNADGTDRRQLTNDRDVDEIEAVWSPAGGTIAFSAQEYPTPETVRSDLVAVDEDGDGAVVLASGRNLVTEPLWSPNGSQILFTTRTRFGSPTAVVSDADGTHHTPLEVGLSSVDAAWSPRSNRIVLVTPRGLTRYDPDPGGVTSRRIPRTAGAAAPDWRASPQAPRGGG